jgi:hypothetical protein
MGTWGTSYEVYAPLLGNDLLKLLYAQCDALSIIYQFGKPPYEVPEGDAPEDKRSRPRL